MLSWVGLTTGWGGDPARITSRMFCGGWLYPDAASAGFADDGRAEEADCAVTREDVAHVKSAAARRQNTALRIFMGFSTSI